MDIVALMYAHPGITVVFLSWIICGLVAIKDPGALVIPFIITFLYGLYRAFK